MLHNSLYLICGAAGVLIFKEASGQGYVTNKVELVSLACEDGLEHFSRILKISETPPPPPPLKGTFTNFVAFKDSVIQNQTAHYVHILCSLILDPHHQLCLTLYHTIPTFNNPKEEGFGKHYGEKEKMLVTSIFSFSHNVFYTVKDRNYHCCNIKYVICKSFQFGPV